MVVQNGSRVNTMQFDEIKEELQDKYLINLQSVVSICLLKQKEEQ